MFDAFCTLLLSDLFSFMHSFKKMCAIIDLFLSELFCPFLLLLSSSFCLYVLCFHGIISDIAMTPFSDPYFYWQNTVRGDGIKVVTIVKLPNSEFPIVAGDVKEMREDLKKIARESSRPGVDYRFTFAPVEVRSFNGSV